MPISEDTDTIIDSTYFHDFDEVQSVLDLSGLQTSAAELQGFTLALCICSNKPSRQEWFIQCLDLFSSGNQADQIDQEDQTFLISFYDFTQAKLANFTLSMDLLLPDDSYPLSQRTKEVAKWCGGFLLGIGLYQTQETLSEYPELESTLLDIEKISNVEIPDDQDSEGSTMEFDLFQITEFLKVATLTFHTELCLSKEAELEKTKPITH